MHRIRKLFAMLFAMLLLACIFAVPVCASNQASVESELVDLIESEEWPVTFAGTWVFWNINPILFSMFPAWEIEVHGYLGTQERFTIVDAAIPCNCADVGFEVTEAILSPRAI